MLNIASECCYDLMGFRIDNVASTARHNDQMLRVGMLNHALPAVQARLKVPHPRVACVRIEPDHKPLSMASPPARPSAGPEQTGSPSDRRPAARPGFHSAASFRSPEGEHT